MAGNSRKVRYRHHLDTLDNLQRDVRELTSEIRSARQELLDEFPSRRRADSRHELLAARLPLSRAAEGPTRDDPKKKRR